MCFVAGLLALVMLPFGIVSMRALLVSGESQLDDLRTELNTQLELREQLLYDRSVAVSPQRIRNTAIEVMGMVPAENVTYLTPQPSVATSPAPAPAAAPISPPTPVASGTPNQ